MHYHSHSWIVRGVDAPLFDKTSLCVKGTVVSFDQTSALLIFEVSCFTGVDVVRTAVGFFAWSSVNVRMMKKVKPPESVQLRTQY